MDPGSGGGCTSSIVNGRIINCPPQLPPVPTPCVQAGALGANSDFNAHMVSLNALVSGTTEQGYKIHSDGTYTNVIGGTSGIDGTQFNLGTGEFISGFIHNHDSDPTGNLSTFSAADIYTMYSLIQNGNADKTLYIGVVTNSGTNYILQINDITKFNNFFGGRTASVFYSSFGAIVNNSNSAAANERALLLYIQSNDMGVTLSKANSNFTSYTRLGLDNDNNPIPNPC
jgi:hypothetical protein